MNKKDRPEWKEIVAFAREILDHGSNNIMIEIMDAGEETYQLEPIKHSDGTFTLELISTSESHLSREEADEEIYQKIALELQGLGDESEVREVFKSTIEQHIQKVLGEKDMEGAVEGKISRLEFDYLVYSAVSILRSDSPLPAILASFVADVLEGKCSRRSKRGPKPSGVSVRNAAFSFAVEVVAKKFGIGRYENGTTKNKTAVDAVSEASNSKTATVMNAYKSCRLRPSMIAVVAKQLGVKLEG